MTKNVQRTQEYIKILHSINSCTRGDQLNSLSELVIKYHKEKKKDSGDLLDEYIKKEESLNPESAADELDSIGHKKLGGHSTY